jgi:adenylate cyclase
MLKNRLVPSLLIGFLVTALLIFLRIMDPITLSTMRGAGFDTMQRLWPRQSANTLPVRIVDIDEDSLKKLGQWPWPRTELAKLVNELNELGAAAIAFDIIFPEPDRLSPDRILNDPAITKLLAPAALNPSTPFPNNDQIFANSISGRRVVLAYAGGMGATAKPPTAKAGFAQTGLPAINAVPSIALVHPNIDILEKAADGLGLINIDFRREQGTARQIPLLMSDGKSYFPSLVLETLRVAQGVDTYVVNGAPNSENVINSIRVGEFEIPVSEDGQLTIYYSHNVAETYVSAERVINGTNRDALRALIANNIVLVGTSATSLQDTKTSSLGEAIPGVSVHAQALQQILSGSFLKRSDLNYYFELLFVGLVGLLISIGTALFRPMPMIISLFVIVSSLLIAAAYAFQHFGLLIDLTFPILSVATIYLATIAFKLLVTDREGRVLRSVFSHYVAPSVLAEIEHNPQALKLGGEMREVTVMFVDIQNFTPMGESLKPEELVTTVNTLLSTCSAGILAHGGTIDKFIGDAVMAFWNAPIAQNEHQYLASLAALEIQNKISEFNADETTKDRLKPHNLWPVSVRIGLATGSAIVGNMGSLERFDYSVLGETVNIASRAEGLCKQIGHNIVIAGQVKSKTKSLAVLDAGAVVMRGKKMKTSIHVVLGNEVLVATPEYQSFAKDYQLIVDDLQSAKDSRIRQRLIKKTITYHPLQTQFLEKLESRIADYQVD